MESNEEREHSQMLMAYQNKRGGRVELDISSRPPSEFKSNEPKSDALEAVELALITEKVNYSKLLRLHTIAEKNNDVSLAGFVEGHLLSYQVESIKRKLPK